MIRTFRRLTLAPGQLADLDDARGTVVRVARGRVWLTQHGDPVDHVLDAGDSWAIERDGRTIVEAQQDALIDLAGSAAAQIVVPVAAPVRASGAAAWIDRLANGWLAHRWVPYY